MGEFITPPSLPPTTYCRRLLIPNSPEWIGAVSGALMSLIYASEWRQTTGITPEEAADRAREMFNLYLDSGNDGECGDMACCGDKPTLHRFNADTGRPQISTDGGATWSDDPADTQNLIPLYPPLDPSGSGLEKCNAATNASEHINELIDATSENLGTAGDVFSLAVAVAEAALGLFLVLVSAGALTAPVVAVATAIWAGATGVFAIGKDLYDAYWTTDKQDAILCALYCNIGDDGQFTEAQYQAVRAKIYAQLPASAALDIIMTAINAGGARGLSQMASYGGAATADCSDCEPCTEGCGLKADGTNTTIVDNGDGTWDLFVDTPVPGGYFVTASVDEEGCCGTFGFVAQLTGTGIGASYIPCGNGLLGWNIGIAVTNTETVQVQFSGAGSCRITFTPNP